MKQPRILFFSALLAAIMALSLVACKGGGGPAAKLSTKNSVVWYIPSDVSFVNPMLVSEEGGNYVDNEVYEALNMNDFRTQAFIPGLASLPVESADHLTWTFTMDPTAHWQDEK